MMYDYNEEGAIKKKTKKELAEEERKKKEREKSDIDEFKREFNCSMGFVVSKFRKEMGMTIEQLAEKIEVDPEYVEKCEAGLVDISVLNMLDFCIVFNMSISRMLGETSFSTFMLRQVRG